MKKKFYGVLIGIILLFLLFTPYLVGVIFKKQYQPTLDILSQNIRLNLKVVRYDRSWFYSNAVIASSFPLADGQGTAEKDVLLIKQHIAHGPFILYHNNQHLKVKLALTYIDSYFDQHHHLADTTFTLGGSVLTHFKLDQYARVKNSLPIYALKGLEGNVSLNAKKSFFSADISIQHIFANINTPRVIDHFRTITQLSSQGELWTGKTSYHFGLLSWQQGASVFTFNQFIYDVISYLQNDRLQYHIASAIKSALLNNVDYGPQHLVFSIKGLDRAELKCIKQLSPINSPEEWREHFRLLLSKGADLHLNVLSLNTAWGQVHGSAHVVCPCFKPADPAPFSNTNATIKAYLPIALANILLNNLYLMEQGEKSLEVAKQQADDSLRIWEQAGWLKTVGTNFVIERNWQHNLIPTTK